jgi:hypothetical protein
MANVTILGKVQNGKFLPVNPNLCEIRMSELEGQMVLATFEKNKVKRSTPQNQYYWGVVLSIFSDATGYTKDEAHDFFRAKFLSGPNDSLIFKICSTAKLSKEEMGQYIDSIIRFCAENGICQIPSPEEMARVA